MPVQLFGFAGVGGTLPRVPPPLRANFGWCNMAEKHAVGDGEGDYYSRLKNLERQIEFVNLQVWCVWQRSRAARAVAGGVAEGRGACTAVKGRWCTSRWLVTPCTVSSLPPSSRRTTSRTR